METQTIAKKSTRKDVYGIINDRIIEQLENGKVPWLASWIEAGAPKGLTTGWPFRGMNVMLCAMLGYERNFFITEKQLEEIGGSIKPKERANMLIHWNFQKDDSSTSGVEIRPTKLGYYMVFNVAQCAGIVSELGLNIERETNPLVACERIVAGLQHGADIKCKEPSAFYDPLEDYINMPKQKTFQSEAHYYSVLFHQVAHSTGHHTRLDRMGLVQMSEYGCDPFTQEELVADIVTAYLQNLTGIGNPVSPSKEYIYGWKEKLKKDPYFIFSVYSLAQKAIDFILNIQSETEEKSQTEE